MITERIRDLTPEFQPRSVQCYNSVGKQVSSRAILNVFLVKRFGFYQKTVNEHQYSINYSQKLS